MTNLHAKDTSSDEQIDSIISEKVKGFLVDEDLLLRKSLIEEAREHRAFLERQLKFALGTAGIILAAFSFATNYFSDKSMSSLETRFENSQRRLETEMAREIDSKFIDYQILKTYQSKMRRSVEQYARGSEIEQLIKNQVDTATLEIVTAQVDATINDVIRRELANIKEDDARQIATSSLRGLKRLENNIKSLEQSFTLEVKDQQEQIELLNREITILKKDVETEISKLELSIESIPRQPTHLSMNQRACVDIGEINFLKASALFSRSPKLHVVALMTMRNKEDRLEYDVTDLGIVRAGEVLTYRPRCWLPEDDSVIDAYISLFEEDQAGSAARLREYIRKEIEADGFDFTEHRQAHASARKFMEEDSVPYRQNRRTGDLTSLFEGSLSEIKIGSVSEKLPPHKTKRTHIEINKINVSAR